MLFLKIYALTGESGSGKSYRAAWLAGTLGIKYIIDDGLLISEGGVVAGSSAKKEKTKMGSTKKAIFFNDADAAAMKKTIQKLDVPSVLIVGTSREMADRIAARLSLGAVERYIDISEIATADEIETAKRVRNTLGMHVIPVPTMAVKRDFQGYFMEKLEVLLAARNYKSEKTVMRPSYSYLGEYRVDRNVIADICRYEAERVRGVSVKDARAISTLVGISPRLNVTLNNIRNITKACADIQDRIAAALEEYLGIVTDKIIVTVSDVTKNEVIEK